MRILSSENHAWVEYSLDNAQTWQTAETWGTYGSEEENPEDQGDNSLIPDHTDRQPVNRKTEIDIPREAKPDSHDQGQVQKQADTGTTGWQLIDYLPGLPNLKALIIQLLSWRPQVQVFDEGTASNQESYSPDETITVPEKKCKELEIEGNPNLWYEPGLSAKSHSFCQGNSVNYSRKGLMRQPYEPIFTEDGELILVQVPVDPDRLKLIQTVSHKPSFITPDQYYERVTLQMTPGQWYRLPTAITARTVDAAWTEYGHQLQLALEPETGFYLVKLAEGDQEVELKVHYLLTQEHFAVIPKDFVDSQAVPPKVEAILDGMPEYRFTAKQDRPRTLVPLIEFLQEALQTYGLRDINRVETKNTVEELLFELLSEGYANSFLRATLFTMILEEMNIRTRIIAGDVHAIAEYSLDNGEHWITAKLDYRSNELEARESRTPLSYKVPVSPEFYEMLAIYEQKHDKVDDYKVNHLKRQKNRSSGKAGSKEPLALPISTVYSPQDTRGDLLRSRFSTTEGQVLGLNILRMEKHPTPDIMNPKALARFIQESDEQMLPYLRHALADISPPAHANQGPWRDFLSSLLKKGRKFDKPMEAAWLGTLEYILLEQQWLEASDWSRELLSLAKAGSKHPLLRAKLEVFYHQLASIRKPPSTEREKDANVEIIPELQLQLAAEALDIEWHQFPEGPPDASRLVRRQPAFRKITGGGLYHSRPALMLISDPDILDNIVKDRYSENNKGSSQYADGRPEIVNAFLHSLQQTVETDLWFLTLDDDQASPAYGLFNTVTGKELKTLISHASSTAKLLDLPRFLKHADLTDAVIIDDNKLVTYFKNYLNRNPSIINDYIEKVTNKK